ncbi:ESX secretion-associated protein EspG [Nocardia rhizosphaerihabitans]|uniref:ESX secretion-associated protein EspG n=1 Tax=Nocardia rhizosphaerihabitans TaxID=1691570 RepID=A0ABQ2KK70_9NOCA|nr:ESX secretion-associated protein EspG [Nocardia rhizosphaerihabitans]GGN85841.1 hypothetical protein GCM10011610_40490 [Nocardia rhizosphaerihabitans]
MSRTWEFTDVEFTVLWNRFIGNHLPRPLTFQTTTRLHDDWEQEKYETWQRLQHTVDPEIRTVFEVLERPEAYVRLRGWNDRHRDDAQYWLKARAARAGARGYIVHQLPGETPTHSGGYVVRECGPHGLAEAVVDLMPKAPAGRQGILPLSTGARSNDSAPRASMFFEDADTTVADRSAEFFETPAERTGTVNILQNQSMFGSRGMHRDILVWRDLPDDGRYAIALPSDEPVATPMAGSALVSAIGKSIDRMMARVESHWEAGV